MRVSRLLVVLFLAGSDDACLAEEEAALPPATGVDTTERDGLPSKLADAAADFVAAAQEVAAAEANLEGKVGEREEERTWEQEEKEEEEQGEDEVSGKEGDPQDPTEDTPQQDWQREPDTGALGQGGEADAIEPEEVAKAAAAAAAAAAAGAVEKEVEEAVAKAEAEAEATASAASVAAAAAAEAAAAAAAAAAESEAVKAEEAAAAAEAEAIIAEEAAAAAEAEAAIAEEAAAAAGAEAVKAEEAAASATAATNGDEENDEHGIAAAAAAAAEAAESALEGVREDLESARTKTAGRFDGFIDGWRGNGGQGNPLKRALGSYDKLLEEHYLKMSFAQATALGVVGDTVAQRLERRWNPGQKFEIMRTVHAGILNMIIDGIFTPRWYNLVDYVNDEMTLAIALVKAIAASVFYGPFANGLFLAGARTLRYGLKARFDWAEWRRQLTVCTVRDFEMWPPLHVLNFWLVPKHWRPVAGHLAGVALLAVISSTGLTDAGLPLGQRAVPLMMRWARAVGERLGAKRRRASGAPPAGNGRA